MALLEIMMELAIWYYLALKKMIPLKDGTSGVYPHNYAKIKIDPEDEDLSLEKTMNMYNVPMIITSDFDKNRNCYSYNVFYSVKNE